MSKDSKRREAIQKRVVSVPFKDRLKGDQITSPPSDSWSWRKYGQKPIKGSPYPRGYYKCSSSKGCPARKQVERSRVDPTMLVLTYTSQHNHTSPPSRNNHHRTAAAAAATSASEEEMEEEVEVEEKPMNLISEDKLITNINCEVPQLINSGEFGWFSDFESTFNYTVIESPALMEDRITTDNELAMIFTMREEEDDESLFAGLGELPECSAVLRRGVVQREVEQRRCSLPTTHLSSSPI
ncbi:hypothetical protein ABFX02_08G132100 [Erythranthe guttata]